jgi:multiple sugar transport system substrate-binding protein
MRQPARRGRMTSLENACRIGAVALLASVGLTACSSGASNKASTGPVTLHMAVWGGAVDKKVYTERLALAKKKFPNITVKLQLVPSADDYNQKIQTAIVGGKGPDILELAETTPVFADKNEILPLDDKVSGANMNLKSMFGDKVPNIFQWKGKQYAIPDRSGAMVVYYNKKLFNKAKVGYPSADWNWQDLLSAAQRLTVRQGSKTTQWGFSTIDWWPYWMSFMYQNGGKVLDSSGKPQVDSSQNVAALQFYNDLAWKYKVAPTPRDLANMKNVGPDQLFAQGKLAMEITGFWNIAAANSVKGLDWDIAPLWHGKNPATSAFFSGLAISRTSKHPADAFKVMQFLASGPGQRPIIDNAEDAPANLQVQASDAFLTPSWSKQPVNMKAFGESAGAIFVPPLTPEWNEMLKVFTDNLDVLFKNQSTPKKTLATIQKQLGPVMKSGS